MRGLTQAMALSDVSCQSRHQAISSDQPLLRRRFPLPTSRLAPPPSPELTDAPTLPIMSAPPVAGLDSRARARRKSITQGTAAGAAAAAAKQRREEREAAKAAAAAVRWACSHPLPSTQFAAARHTAQLRMNGAGLENHSALLNNGTE